MCAGGHGPIKRMAPVSLGEDAGHSWGGWERVGKHVWPNPPTPLSPGTVTDWSLEAPVLFFPTSCTL